MRAALALGLLTALPAYGQPLTEIDRPRSADDQARVTATLTPPGDFTKPEAFEANPAGAATVPASDRPDALTHPFANLPAADLLDFSLGHALFGKLWIAAPSSTRASDGLGPLYNTRSCEGCHQRDGRGQPPSGAGPAASFVLRLATPGGTAEAGIADYLATRPDPSYGRQLNDAASPGQTAEGRVIVTYAPLPVTLEGGSVITLRRPTYRIGDLAYGPLATDLMISPRVAPQMIGLGLLEAIPAADILSREDPDDADGDGISGRANIVLSPSTGRPMLGRFGLKAGVATLRDQTAQALVTDMGLSTTLHPDPAGDCTPAQTACLAAPTGEDAGLRDRREVDDAALDLIASYASHIAVPARRNTDDPATLRGKEIFHALNCTGCHTPKHVTAGLPARPERSFQLIWPYTDLLLHDMGDGLADTLPEARATGREWRTAPLWGLGLVKQVSPEAGYLHDGRARTVLEAILWHGGEAEAHRNAVIALPKPDRDALIAFLESL